MGRQLIVIGGGVIGCSVAWHLAALSDYDVVLIERDRLGSGTTWHSAGNITWRPGAQHDEMVVYAYWNVFGEVTITRVSGLFGVILILEMAV